MASFSQTQMALQDALQAFSQGDVGKANHILDAAAVEESARTDVDEALSICCMRASMAAMEGGNNVGEIMSQVGSGSPQHAALTSYLEGLASLAKGNTQSARMHFDEARQQDSYLIFANLGLAAVFFQQRKYKESFAQYREVLSVLGSRDAPSVVRVGMALCAYHLRRLDYAKKVLERALEVNADDELALLCLLVVYLDGRLINKVTETVMRLRRLLPYNITVLLKVADLMYFKAVAQHRLKPALRSVRSLVDQIRRLGAVDDDRALCDFQEGRILLASGDVTGALVLLESALRTLPRLLPARIHHARAVLLIGGRETEGMQLLLNINRDRPNQREVLQLLAAHASRRGQHEAALDYCRLLTESVAQGDLRSWSLAAWCARLDSAECRRLLMDVARKYQVLERRPPWQLLANVAVLNGDVAALQGIVDAEVGADVLLGSSGSVSTEHVPLIFNLALLLEHDDEARARALYILLVKHHSHFRLPYFRLHLMAKAQGHVRQAAGWLALLQQVLPDEPVAQAYIGELFFEKKRYMAAIEVLRESKAKSVPVALALGSIYLWCSQQHGKDAMRFLASAKDRFRFVLRADSGNVLAAHGLACCLGLEGDTDHCQSLLDRVGEVVPNRDYVRSNQQAHMANVKIECESYKQAADYLRKEQKRTPHQDSSLAFCLTQEGNFDEAIALLSSTLEANRDDHILLYNTALVYCSAFIYRIAHCSSLSVEEGRKLRQLLERGLALASEYTQLTPTFSTTSIARVFLRSASAYCLHLFDSWVPRLISMGVESEAEREQESQRWAEALAVYKAEAAREQQAKEEAEARKALEQESFGREVLETFKTKREAYPMTLFDNDLRTAMNQELQVVDFDEPNAFDGNFDETEPFSADEAPAATITFADDDTLAY